MIKGILSNLILVMAVTLFSSYTVLAKDTSPIQVKLQHPAGTLRMGDTPKFTGAVTNSGQQTLRRLIVYLSLVSLEPGNERPVDLEDWSAQKALGIDSLSPGQVNTHDWGMRLIQAGKYGVALTVIDPTEKKPIVSDLVPFDVKRKPTLSASRIFPVAIGEPVTLLMLFGVILIAQRRGRL